MINILIATPAYGNSVSLPYMHSVMSLIEEGHKINIQFKTLTIGHESLIQRARNRLACEFLQLTEYSHLLFIDADIGFEAKSVFRMLEFDKDIVAGVYPSKVLDWENIKHQASSSLDKLEQRSLRYNINVVNPKATTSENGFVKALDAATGFMLIKRNVLTTMIEKFPEIEYTSDYQGQSSNSKQWAFFECAIDPDTKRYLSEDYFFCRKWQSIGGEIWCDIMSPLQHVGNYTYNGDISSTIWVAKKHHASQDRAQL